MAKKKKKDYKSNIGGGSTRGTYEPQEWEKEINKPKQAKANNRSKLAMVELPNIKKDLKGEVKGTITGPRSGGRNDVKNKDWRKIQANKKRKKTKKGYA
tara:strand:+ start:423 stop:719 length:297 start_codon:yes stop_codon:yes gene_type:complete